jgi:hypothetical protein
MSRPGRATGTGFPVGVAIGIGIEVAAFALPCGPDCDSGPASGPDFGLGIESGSV